METLFLGLDAACKPTIFWKIETGRDSNSHVKKVEHNGISINTCVLGVGTKFALSKGIITKISRSSYLSSTVLTKTEYTML